MRRCASDPDWTVDDLYALPDDGRRHEIQVVETLDRGDVVPGFAVRVAELLRI